MKEKQKLIVTLWRGQLDSPKNYDSICCRLIYNAQQQSSRHIHATKSLTWKQTFVFPLAKYTSRLKLDFLNMQQIKQIHFAKDQVMDSLTIGKSHVQIDLDNSNRGTVPAKLSIINQNEQHLGIVFLEYQILKTQVTYIVEKLLDYQYLLKLSTFKVTFLRPLNSVPSLYLKFKYGQRVHKQDFAFEQFSETFIYNYPIKLYIRYETQVQIQLQIKDNYRKDYRNPNTSFDTESIASNAISIRKNNKKNQILDLRQVQKLSSNLDLNIKKAGVLHKKLPLWITVKGQSRQIATIEFDIDITFKSQKQKQQLQIQRKRQVQIKQGNHDSQKQMKKKQKKYQIPKNGFIIINSIIAKFQMFVDQIIKDKDVSIQSKLGKVIQSSVILENPGTQIIWMDTFTFKRTWQENIKFIVYLHSDSVKLPKYYSQVNIRDLFEMGRYMAKKLEIRDDKDSYCGAMIVDIEYKQEQQKIKVVQQKKAEPELTVEEKQELGRDLKQKNIRERMRVREEAKKKRLAEFESSIPSYSDKQIYLPPLRSSRNNSQGNTTLSPRKSQHSSVNIYNTGGSIVINRQPRFYNDKKQSHDSFFYNAQSVFDGNKNKGTSIGYGNKFDFTKQYQKAPGAGRYQLPSMWDKYK